MTKLLLVCLLIKVICSRGYFLNKTEESPQALLIVAGGQGYGNEPQLYTGEVFIPSSGKSCFISDLPDTRISHSMNGEYLCGGLWVTDYDVQTTCMRFSPEENEWTYSHTLAEKRVGHVSWMTEQGLVLMGGWMSDTTSEIVALDGGEGEPAFEMNYRTKYACAIPDMDKPSVILTGGGFDEEAGRRVSRYNIHGFVKDLPHLKVTRMDHGCGSYRREDGTQILLVAGGMSYEGMHTNSVEILEGDSGSWREVTSLPPLPHNREGYGGINGATIGNILYMTGGYDGMYEHNEILEWKDDTEEWLEIGKMKMTRSFHSVTTIPLDQIGFCD